MVTIAQDHFKYYSPMRAKLEVRSLNDKELYYSYNPFTATNTSAVPTFLQISRSFAHQGTLRLGFEDADYILDKTKIRTPARVKVWLSKEDANWTGYFHGFVRASMPSMHGGNTNLLELQTPGLQQRTNERLLDFQRTDPNVLDDGITLDTTDVDHQADEMIEDSLRETSQYPQDITSGMTEGTNGYDFLDESDVKDSGLFKDFIHSIEARFVTIQDFWNMIESHTGGRVYVNFDSKVQFTPLQIPIGQNKGFKLTRKANPLVDHAESTCQIVGNSYKQLDSFFVDSGYANRQVGILSSEPTPDTENPPSHSNFTSNLSNEIAMLIRVPTNPNWELWVGVGLNDGTDADRHVQRSRWRFVEDSWNKTTNTHTLVNNEGTINSFFGYEGDYNITQGGLQWLRIARSRVELDSEVSVWLVLTSVNASSTTGYWQWYHDNSEVGLSATAPAGETSDADGGTNWTYNRSGPTYVQQFIRFKDKAFSCTFNGAVKNRSLIEQGIGNFPQQVDTPYAAVKYMLALGRFRSSPQRTYPNIIVRAPNRPIFEGDIFDVRIPQHKLGTPGRVAEIGQISEINYNFGGEPGAQGGAGANSLGAYFLDLTLRTYPVGY